MFVIYLTRQKKTQTHSGFCLELPLSAFDEPESGQDYGVLIETSSTQK